MTEPLAGRVALVTGSARRLGRSLVEAIAADGAAVAVHYRHSQAEADEVVAGIQARGGQAAAFAADVTDPVSCEDLVAAVVAHFGGLHILVNNVGDFHAGSILDHDVSDWRAMLASNLDSVFYMCHHAIPHLRANDYGRIVNLGFAGSGNLVASPEHTAYAVAKTGALVLTRSLAVALGATPLTVNMVSPGVLADSVSYPPLADVPKGRWARADEVVGAVRYFLSADGAYVTGQHLEVAGGWAL